MPSGRFSITKPSKVPALCSIDGDPDTAEYVDAVAASAVVARPSVARTTALPVTIRRADGITREPSDERDMTASWERWRPAECETPFVSKKVHRSAVVRTGEFEPVDNRPVS